MCACMWYREFDMEKHCSRFVINIIADSVLFIYKTCRADCTANFNGNKTTHRLPIFMLTNMITIIESECSLELVLEASRHTYTTIFGFSYYFNVLYLLIPIEVKCTTMIEPLVIHTARWLVFHTHVTSSLCTDWSRHIRCNCWICSLEWSAQFNYTCYNTLVMLSSIH